MVPPDAGYPGSPAGGVLAMPKHPPQRQWGFTEAAAAPLWTGEGGVGSGRDERGRRGHWQRRRWQDGATCRPSPLIPLAPPLPVGHLVVEEAGEGLLRLRAQRAAWWRERQ